ncbi:MAG TPA: NapC/NirT family cytochrome c [Acidobacteriota bacterium]|jgi:hypothetical protein
MTGLKSALRAALFAILAGVPGYAQDPKESFQHDPVEYLASRFLVWVLVIGLGLVLLSLFQVIRGRFFGPFFKSLVITSVVMVPLLAVSTGMLLVFTRAERVEFCATCHLTMKAYVEDMKNSKSEGLAAMHYRNQYIHSNQCYECHTSYGLFGTFEAKTAGMVDVYKYYTRTYKLPIKMRHPYENGDCLKCHAQSVKFRSVSEHTDALAEIYSGRMGCQDCHGIANPAHPIQQKL